MTGATQFTDKPWVLPAAALRCTLLRLATGERPPPGERERESCCPGHIPLPHVPHSALPPLSRREKPARWPLLAASHRCTLPWLTLASEFCAATSDRVLWDKR